eukprot:6191030-Pleurochrysis_carterae.AAC.1
MAGAVKGLQVVRTKRVCVSAPACVRQRVGGREGGREGRREGGKRKRERLCSYVWHPASWQRVQGVWNKADEYGYGILQRI